MPFQKLPGLQKYTLVLVTAFLAFVFIIPSAAIWQSSKRDPAVAKIGTTKLTETDRRHLARVVELVYSAELRMAAPGDYVWVSHYTREVATKENRLYNHMSLALLARQSGVYVSDERMQQHMLELFEKNGGREELTKQLDTLGVNQSEFIEGVREVLQIRQLLSFLYEHQLKRDYQSAYELLRKEGRRYSFRMVRIDRRAVQAEARGDAKIDAALREFYQGNKELFGRPARVMFELAYADRQALRERIEEGVSREELERFLEQEPNRKQVIERIGRPSEHAGHRHAAPRKLRAVPRESAEQRKVKPWPPEKDQAKQKQAPVKQEQKQQQPAKRKPVEWTAKKLLAEHEELVRDLVVDQRAAAQSKSAWDQLDAALTLDPEQNLQKLAARVGLSYRRAEEYLERSALTQWTAEFGEKLTEALFALEPGKIGPLSSERPERVYRVRLLDRIERRRRPYKELSRDDLLRALHKQKQASFRTEAVYELDVVAARYERWARPAPLSTGELQAFYEEHRELLFKGKSFAETRLDVERLASRGGLEQRLGRLIESVRGRVEQKGKQPPAPPRGRQAPPPPSQDLAAQLKADLAGPAREAGLLHLRVKLAEKQLNEHPLFGGGKFSGLDLQNQKPGWISTTYKADDRQFFVRLLAVEPAADKPFETSREELTDPLLEPGLKQALEARAKAVRADLVKGFAEGAARHGLELLSFKDVRRASDLTRLPEDERDKVFGELPGLGGKGEIGEVFYVDRVAFILQLTGDRHPEQEEVESFRIKQRAEKQLGALFDKRIYNLWLSPRWYVQSGFPEFKPLALPEQPRKKSGPEPLEQGER